MRRLDGVSLPRMRRRIREPYRVRNAAVPELYVGWPLAEAEMSGRGTAGLSGFGNCTIVLPYLGQTGRRTRSSREPPPNRPPIRTDLLINYAHPLTRINTVAAGSAAEGSSRTRPSWLSAKSRRRNTKTGDFAAWPALRRPPLGRDADRYNAHPDAAVAAISARERSRYDR